ncbi:unnamed protein product [Bemisia tabaci]|uniref:SPRY domain-containing protein 7 n=1 Tax=Bemisia tabaci TaxID=7038 RepID=A0A9P0AAJ6_BEMTA|nr:unnamed protein product [Bemisia tabaci]
MSIVYSCFKNCFNGVSFPAHHIPRHEFNPIVLDTGYVGHEVVIVKNGIRICGTGGALCTAPLVQNKAYFEVKLQQSGVWAVGVATRNANLNKAPGGEDSESWVLCHDGRQRHNAEDIGVIEAGNAVEGDVIGISYDHEELNFYVNGKNLGCPVLGIKGTVFPALFVDEGAILDLIVDNFQYPVPPGYDRIMLEQSLL